MGFISYLQHIYPFPKQSSGWTAAKMFSLGAILWRPLKISEFLPPVCSVARVNSGNRVISIHFRGDRLTQGISQDGHLKQHFHSPQSKQVPRLGRDCIVQSRLRVLVYKYQFYPIIAPFIKSGPITISA